MLCIECRSMFLCLCFLLVLILISDWRRIKFVNIDILPKSFFLLRALFCAYGAVV